MHPGEERARLWLIHLFMTASRKDFPGENFTTLRAGIRITCPVNGLRTGRALRSRTQKDPTPDHESISPAPYTPPKYSRKRSRLSRHPRRATRSRRLPLLSTPACSSLSFFYCSCLTLYAGFSCPRVSDRKGTGKAPLEAIPPKRVARVPLHIRHVYSVQPFPAGSCLTMKYR